MRLKELAKYDIPEMILDAWKNRQGEYLLPLQEKAIRAGLLPHDRYGMAENLLISAPTSAGKSFCGEMAAMATLLKRKKAVMLLPLKSIAEEKYEHFRTCYKNIGIRIIIVTGDHPENDIDFELGNFDLALVIYEKFNRLLTVNVDVLQQIGLVVIDEFQMVGDPERGPELEMALTKIITSNYGPRLIALSAVIDEADDLARWLSCRIIRETVRPVDLMQGIVSEGCFHFRSFNSGIEGRENFELYGNNRDLTESLIEFLKNDSARKLIFLKSRRDTIAAAFRLAAAVDWSEAGVTLGQLEYEEKSFLIRSLRQVLSRGVAFHNADLTPSQRRAVEQGYMRGEIKVIFSTTTLAMGVNLPAEMVLLETMKYVSGNFGGKPSLVPITPSEFQNITGRAGRFGLSDRDCPGRAIILAGSEFEHEVLWSSYIETRRSGPVVSALGNYRLEDIILDFAVSGIAADRETLQKALGGTFGYRVKAIDPEALDRAVASLRKSNLLHGEITPGPAGEAVAQSGLSSESYSRLKIRLNNGMPRNLIGWLTATLAGGDFNTALASLTASEYRGRQYERLFLQEFSEFLGEANLYCDARIGREPVDFRTAAVLKAVVLLSEWAEGRGVEELEQRYQLHHGQIVHLAENAAWLLAAAGKIVRAGDAGSVLPRELDDYSFAVQFGVPSEMRFLHSLAGNTLNRNDYRILRENNLKFPGEIISMPREKLSALIQPEAKLNHFLDEIKTLQEEDNMGRFMSTINRAQLRPHQSAPAGTALPVFGAHPSSLDLDGCYEGERYLIKIDGFPVRLTGKSFKYLVKLAHARLISHEGWIYKDEIEAGFNQARYLYRLKQEINRDGGCPWTIFENNRLGYYRLDLEPSKITLNLENLKTHPDYELQRIAGELAPRLVS
ncbi:putative Helicase [Candidatus Zixiibacteriota bacterium]|nr:putative Helicase [candidate division Zixibacteria bacterium]